jgi:hypothetical protein
VPESRILFATGCGLLLGAWFLVQGGLFLASLVMLAARDVTLDLVMTELERREGTSGLAEKAARG